MAKFSGAYDAATREKSSGQNENDVVKLAHQIFYNNHQKRFTLEHAWKELRNDQKWCDLTSAKNDGSSKKRKCEDPADSSTHEASDSKRPPGVKAAKATGKNKEVQQHTMNEFQNMWTIREKDMAVNERMAKMSMLECLIGRTEGLDEEEKVLKKKLITTLCLVSCVSSSVSCCISSSDSSSVSISVCCLFLFNVVYVLVLVVKFMLLSVSVHDLQC